MLELSESSAIDMLRGLVKTLEGHHKVRILSEAVEDAVKLSSRYISGRQLPDKAVSLLDTTCGGRIGLSQNSTPPEVESCARRLAQLETLIGILERETQAGADHSIRINDLRSKSEEVAKEKLALETRWQAELNLVSRINELRQTLAKNMVENKGAETTDTGTLPATPPAGEVKPSSDEVKRQVVGLENELKVIQGETPLVFACCDGSSVAATVAAWTGIPVGRMVANAIRHDSKLQGQERWRNRLSANHMLWSKSRRASGLHEPSLPIQVAR